jgi:hypothetical protein
METLTTRNKAEARRIESWVQRQIADLGPPDRRSSWREQINRKPVAGKPGTEHVAAAGHPDFEQGWSEGRF